MSNPKHLKPIKPISACELITRQIERAVHMGLLVPGDRLPPERELAQQLGVARMTVREAVRVLAREGRIAVRRGVQGGMWIMAQEVNERQLARLAADTDRAIGDVYEFREAIERAAARLAASRAGPKDIRALRRLAGEMRDIVTTHLKHPLPAHVPQFLALDSQFHREIARISGNAFLADAVERALAARYAPFGAIFRALTPDASDGHEPIVDAIAAGDGARAENLMGAHIGESRAKLLSVLNRRLRTQPAR